VLVAWYPFASNSLKAAASQGIATVLDVGSTHPHHQYRLLCRSHRQFGLPMPWEASRVLSHTWAFDLVDRIMVPSRAVEDTFLTAGVAAEKLRRNPYGIDAKIFKPSQSFRRTNPFDASNPLKVLTVASLTPRKGANALLEICRYFQSRPEIAFTMVGSIDTLFQQKLKSIPANLTILKAGSHQWLADQYQLHQVSLLPSLEEGFARVLLEAAASGCFLLATEPTGLSDLLEKDSSVGFLLSGDTVRSAIDCLEEILAGKCALGDLSIEARNYFSRSSYQQRAVDLLAELAGTV
jgi:glycosyltransferase involved in cell wall biosynthesis